jgi:hypothetical protein
LVFFLALALDVRDLGAPSFATREWAQARLEAWGWVATVVLDRPWASAERNARARRIVRAYRRPLRREERYPLITTLSTGGRSLVLYRDGQRWALESVDPPGRALGPWPCPLVERYLKEAGAGRPASLDQQRHATRLLEEELLRGRVPRPLVRLLLSYMDGVEAGWTRLP